MTELYAQIQAVNREFQKKKATKAATAPKNMQINK